MTEQIKTTAQDLKTVTQSATHKMAQRACRVCLFAILGLSLGSRR